MTNTSPCVVEPAGEDRVRLETRFGPIDAATHDLVQFPRGLPGFELCRRFAVLSLPELAPLHCLHAVDGPPASFLAIDPRLVLSKYRLVLRAEDRARIGDPVDHKGLVWLALVSVDAAGAAWVNLRSPVVINPLRMIGCQLIPHDTLYPIRHPLLSASPEVE
jgi:flagellar assembly factor FliW